jgi:hypothetical protein
MQAQSLASPSMPIICEVFLQHHNIMQNTVTSINNCANKLNITPEIFDILEF